MDELNTQQPKFVFRKEREFGEIISDSFSFFTQNHKSLTNIFLKLIGPFILLMVLASTIYQYKTGDLLSDISIIGANPDIFIDALVNNVLVFSFFIISSVLASVVIYGTVLHCIKVFIEDNGLISLEKVSAGLKKDFIRILGYSILAGLVIVLGFLLCIIPGVYLMIVLSPGIAILIMEDISVTDVFSRAFKLIKDNWWITFATILVFSILISILGLVFQIPSLIYTMVETFTIIDVNPGDSSAISGMYQNWLYLLLSAISIIGQYFLSIFSVIMIALVYFNLSEKHDHTGTYNQIENIGS